MKALNGYKTYISAAAIIILSLAGISGISLEDLVADAEKVVTAFLGFAAIYGRWDRERRGS